MFCVIIFFFIFAGGRGAKRKIFLSPGIPLQYRLSLVNVDTCCAHIGIPYLSLYTYIHIYYCILYIHIICLITIDKYFIEYYNNIRNQEVTKTSAGGKEMQDGMTNDQLNTLLETIAKLIEAEAITAQQAAQIVREAKTK